MNVIDTAIAGVKIIEPRVFGDARGYFFESYNRRGFAAATGLDGAREGLLSSRALLTSVNEELVGEGRNVQLTAIGKMKIMSANSDMLKLGNMSRMG